MKKRVISMAISLAMVLSLMSMPALAEEQVEELAVSTEEAVNTDEAISEETEAAAVIEPTVEEPVVLEQAGEGTDENTAFETIVKSGTAGENITWTLDDSGVLTISGSGDMDDYDHISSEDPQAKFVPWADHIENITSVIVGNGVTGIGDCSFSGCKNLLSVTLPDGIITIGYSAFSECGKLERISLPESVSTIGQYAFDYCTSLKSITVPYGVTKVEYNTFSNCSELTDVTLPESLTEIEGSAFRACSSLNSITIPEGVTIIGFYVFSGCSALSTISIPESLKQVWWGAFEGLADTATVTYAGECKNIDNIWINEENEQFAAALNKNHNTYEENIAAGCETNGYKNIICSDCGKTVESTLTSYSLGHIFGKYCPDGIDDKGIGVICERCGEKISLIYDATVTIDPKSIKNTTGGPRLYWSRVKGATHYYVYADGVCVKTLTAEKNYTNIPKCMEDGKEYSFQVRAVFKNDAGTYKAQLSDPEKWIYVDKAEVTSIATQTGGTAVVNWNKIGSADYYQVAYSTDKTFGTYNIKTVNKKYLKKTLTGLENGKRYYVLVRGYKTLEDGSRDYGTWSKLKNFTAK